MEIDLTLIWEDEYTHDQWVQRAIQERWSSILRRDHFYKDCGNCWRPKNHQGPCIQLRWDVRSIGNGISAISLVEHKPEDSPKVPSILRIPHGDIPSSHKFHERHTWNALSARAWSVSHVPRSSAG